MPELPGIVAEWDAALAEVARSLLRHWAASLGSPADVFDAAFAGAPATLIKIVHYPATAASSQGVGAHRDSGVLTLLLAEPGSQGLQVRAGRDGDWVDVPARDGAFIVNIGELLELATGGYLRATEHRVNLRHAADRISVPYFFNPRLDAQIPTLSLPAELAARAAASRGPVRSDLLGVRPQCLEEQAAGTSGRCSRARLRDGQRTSCNARRVGSALRNSRRRE